MLSTFMLRDLVARSLQEDVGSGDLTTLYAVPRDASGEARITAKQSGIICGLPVAEAVFEVLDRELRCRRLVAEGEPVELGCQFCRERSLCACFDRRRTP